MPVMSSPLGQALRTKRKPSEFLESTKRSVANAELLGEMDAGGRNNRFGAQIGRIGEVPVELPATGQFMRQNKAGLSNFRPGESNFPGGVGAPPPQPNGIVAGPVGRMTPAGFQGISPPTLGGAVNISGKYSDQRKSPGEGYDVNKVAQHRARAGMRLNADEQAAVDNMPGGLAAVLKGSMAERHQQSKNLVRQRGIEAGQAKAMARNFGTLTAAGMPQQGAMMQLLAGGQGQGQSNPLREVLLYGQGGASDIARERIQSGAKPQQLTPQQAFALDTIGNDTTLSATDKLRAGQKVMGGANLGDVLGGGATAGVPRTSFTQEEQALGLTEQQVQAGRQLQGNEKALRDYATKEGLPPAAVDNFVKQYAGSSWGEPGEWAVNAPEPFGWMQRRGKDLADWWNTPKLQPPVRPTQKGDREQLRKQLQEDLMKPKPQSKPAQKSAPKPGINIPRAWERY